MVTWGDAPNAPVTATDAFAVGDPAAELDDVPAVRDDDPVDEELEEELQPATAAAASNGMMSSADARRMATSRIGPRVSGPAGLERLTAYSHRVRAAGAVR
jgi:hypothetical protein